VEEVSRVGELPTLWGLDPIQLHARYWAALGVQVVRQGEPSQIVPHAELYLLMDPRPLMLFPLWRLTRALNWIKPKVLLVRLRDRRERMTNYRPTADAAGRFTGFASEASDDPRMQRVGLTPEVEVARLWQSAPDAFTGWRRMRRYTASHARMTMSLDGRVFDQRRRSDIALFVSDLQRTWRHPNAVIGRARRNRGWVWHDPSSVIDATAELSGAVWVGAGRTIGGGTTVVGPRVLWDDPGKRPEPEGIQWLEIEPVDAREER